MYGWVGEYDSEGAVHVRMAVVDRLAALWSERWRREPTREELKSVLDDFVQELLYHEALAMRLEENDTG